MARIARLVVPNYPHHITQRGSRRQQTFFNEDDYADYVSQLAAARHKSGVEIWAYCLMPNHVHIVAIPESPDSLTRLFKTAHLRYTRRVNRREGWQGHLWQERFHSFVMDERHLLMAVRYIELNPVRAGLCRRPEEWPWSSVHAHLQSTPDLLIDPGPMLRRIGDWAAYLGRDEAGGDGSVIRRHGKNGRPAGSDAFLAGLESLTGRRLRPLKPGRKSGNSGTVNSFPGGDRAWSVLPSRK
jgi:putative transposase